MSKKTANRKFKMRFIGQGLRRPVKKVLENVCFKRRTKHIIAKH